MYSLKVIKSEKIDIQADNETRLDVYFDILDENGDVVESRRQNFPLSTSEDEMKAELSKFIQMYNDDAERKIANAELDAAHAQADETIVAIEGLVVTDEVAASVTQAQPVSIETDPLTSTE